MLQFSHFNHQRETNQSDYRNSAYINRAKTSIPNQNNFLCNRALARLQADESRPPTPVAVADDKELPHRREHPRVARLPAFAARHPFAQASMQRVVPQNVVGKYFVLPPGAPVC